MKHISLTAMTLGLGLVAHGALAQDKAAATAAEVRAADIAWEKRAQEVSVAQSFRETMDSADGLQFGGGAPNRGADAIYKAMGGDKSTKASLQWTVTDAWGSRGGDMGVTSGTFVAPTTPGKAVRGHYVTVWRRNTQGQWKVLIDIGNPDPQ